MLSDQGLVPACESLGFYEGDGAADPELLRQRAERYWEIEEQSEKEWPYLEELAADAAEEYEADGEAFELSRKPVNDLKTYSTNICNHCVRVGVLGGAVARGLDVPAGPVFLSGLVHDVGKGDLPRSLNAKSISGIEEWMAGDRALMNEHVSATAHRIALAGLPAWMIRVGGNHHAMQEFNSIGSVSGLSMEERKILACMTIADFADSVFRNDRVEEDQAHLERIARVGRHAARCLGMAGITGDGQAVAERTIRTREFMSQQIMSAVAGHHRMVGRTSMISDFALAS